MPRRHNASTPDSVRDSGLSRRRARSFPLQRYRAALQQLAQIAGIGRSEGRTELALHPFDLAVGLLQRARAFRSEGRPKDAIVLFVEAPLNERPRFKAGEDL